MAEALIKVSSGQPVNFKNLASMLEKLGVSHYRLRRIFNAELVGKDRYRVEIIDQPAFDELLLRYGQVTVDGRVAAAKAGNSHRISVDGSYLLMKTSPQAHPQVITFTRGDFTLPESAQELTHTLLLVENLQNFLMAEQTLVFCYRYCGLPSELRPTIVFGQGNAIANRYHERFLSHFDQVFALFDLDVGGMRIFKSLLDMGLPKHKTHFLLPSDAQSRLTRSPRIVSDEHRSHCLRFQGTHPDLERAAGLIRETGRTLEQELYLDKENLC